jgi:hypothetical protein
MYFPEFPNTCPSVYFHSHTSTPRPSLTPPQLPEHVLATHCRRQRRIIEAEAVRTAPVSPPAITGASSEPSTAAGEPPYATKGLVVRIEIFPGT